MWDWPLVAELTTTEFKIFAIWKASLYSSPSQSMQSRVQNSWTTSPLLPSSHPPTQMQSEVDKISRSWEIFKKKSALMWLSKAEEWSDKRTMDRAGSHTRKGNDCVFFCTCSWVFEKSTLCRHVGLWPSFTISTPLDSVSTGEIAFLSANSLLCLPTHHVAWISGSMHAAKQNPQPHETLCWGSAEGLLYMHSIEV